jgi:hypothetical protein
MANEGLLYINGWNAALDAAIKAVQRAKIYDTKNSTQEKVNTALNAQCVIIKDLESLKRDVVT